MIETLFPKFMEDDDEYNSLRAYWAGVFDEAENRFHGRFPLFPPSKSLWRGWMQDIFHDGMPVLSQINRELRRGFSIYQVPQFEDPVWFRGWIEKIEDRGDEIDFLAIYTIPHKAAADRALILLRKFVDMECSIEDVAELAANLTENSPHEIDELDNSGPALTR